FLDAGIDVGDVERRDAGLGEGAHVLDGGGAVDRAVPARKVPATLPDARDLEPGRDRRALDAHAPPFFFGSGTAGTSPWRKVRCPVRRMRKRAPQLGSGQAMRSSVLIQSLGWVSRWRAGKCGRRPASV